METYLTKSALFVLNDPYDSLKIPSEQQPPPPHSKELTESSVVSMDSGEVKSADIHLRMSSFGCRQNDAAQDAGPVYDYFFT